MSDLDDLVMQSLDARARRARDIRSGLRRAGKVLAIYVLVLVSLIAGFAWWAYFQIPG